MKVRCLFENTDFDKRHKSFIILKDAMLKMDVLIYWILLKKKLLWNLLVSIPTLDFELFEINFSHLIQIKSLKTTFFFENPKGFAKLLYISHRNAITTTDREVYEHDKYVFMHNISFLKWPQKRLYILEAGEKHFLMFYLWGRSISAPPFHW